MSFVPQTDYSKALSFTPGDLNSLKEEIGQFKTKEINSLNSENQKYLDVAANYYKDVKGIVDDISELDYFNSCYEESLRMARTGTYDIVHCVLPLMEELVAIAREGNMSSCDLKSLEACIDWIEKSFEQRDRIDLILKTYSSWIH